MQRMVQMLAVAVFAWILTAGTAAADSVSEHTGLLVEAGNGKIKIKEEGKEAAFDVANDVKITFEGRESTLQALPADHLVKLRVVTEKKKPEFGGAEITTTKVISIDLPAPWNRTPAGVIAIVLAVVAISFGAGRWVSRSLRMPSHDWKIALMVFCVLIGTTVTWLGWPPILGIDLSGGVRLVYAIDRGRDETPTTTADDKDKDKAKADAPRQTARTIKVGDMIGPVSLRLNPGGQKEIIVRTYGQDEIEIVIPKADPIEIERIKEIVSTSGLLEFRILAAKRTDAGIVDIAKTNSPKEKVVHRGDQIVARWVLIDKKKFPEPEHSGMETRLVDGQYEALVLEDPSSPQVNGGDLDYSQQGFDASGPCVNFHFKEAGAAAFSELTGKFVPDTSVSPPFKRKLGIILDNTLLSAPDLNGRIGAHGQITGRFTEAEVKNLVEILNAGSLPAALIPQPVAEENIDALLGAETVRTAFFAMCLASIAVPAFMIFYYRFSGLVATATTALHMLLIVAVMILIKAPFTLTGLAGLALTVGMAVDANVLIYERMREELARGAALKMAIRNGFDRALHTIIDTNVTTLIAATVLYVIGTDQVKGFAVTLWLGVVLNVFTATFGTRVLFDVAEKMHLLKKLKMMRIIGVPSIDFMGKQRIWLGISVLTTIIGLVSFFSLGRRVWDIDFTGGSSVDVIFMDKFAQKDSANVQKALEQTIQEDKTTLDDLNVYKISVEGQTPDTLYRIVTSDQDVEKVKREIAKAFEGKLKILNVKLGAVAAVSSEPAQPDKKPPLSFPFPPPVTAPPEAPQEPPATDKKDQPEGEKAPATEKTDKSDKAEKTPTDPPADDKKSPDLKSSDKNSTDKKTSAIGLRFQPAVQLASTSPSGVLLALADGDEKPSGEKTKADGKSQETLTKKADHPLTLSGTNTYSGSTTISSGVLDLDDKAKTEDTAKGDDVPRESKVKITLSEATNYATVNQFLKAAEEKLKDKLPEVRHELSYPKYDGNPHSKSEEWEVRLSVPPAKAQLILDEFVKLAESPNFLNAAQLGPQVADKTEQQTMYALVASWVLIILYVWIRFQRVAYGLAAVIALIHDVIVAVGALALCHYLYNILPPGMREFLLIEPFKVNLTIIAAMLTIIGYSVNDTIVVFDRIREVKGKAPDVTDQIVNDSINQTLSRTLLTSFTVFLVVLILYIFGGIGVRAFAFTMMIGVLTGTYSSIYIASPILVWMERLGKSHRDKAKLANTSPANVG